MQNAELSYRLALGIATQLVESGVEYVVASPGFRNSPLVLACRKTKGLKTISAVDERGAAFFALGISRTSKKPVAVLCTSGTAVANYFPAVMEANYSHVPLVVLTADRPAELVGTGANQCADQIHFFGSQVRHFAAIEPAQEGSQSLAHAKYATGNAISLALSPRPGPVHINVRFREPFLPDSVTSLSVETEEAPQKFWKFLGSASGPSKEQADAIQEVMRHSKRTLILLGPSGFGEDRIRAIVNFAGYSIPVIAESASGAAFGNESVVSHHVDILLQGMLSELIEPPELILRFGAPLVSKNVGAILKKFQPAQIIFDEYGEARDPEIYPSIFIQGGIDGWITQMKKWSHSSDRAWKEKIVEINTSIDLKVSAHLDKFPLTERFFHRHLEKLISENSSIFLGNSMPIRDFNSAFPGTRKNLRVLSNRGQSGIDGLIASAAGTALAHGKETHAILGDLSTLHDLPSLALVSALREDISLTLWIMNNGGGEIFRMVPTAKSGAKADWFTTPQDLDFASLSKSFKIPYLMIRNKEELLELDSGAFTKGIRIIELIFDPIANLEVRKSFSAL